MEAKKGIRLLGLIGIIGVGCDWSGRGTRSSGLDMSSAFACL